MAGVFSSNIFNPSIFNTGPAAGGGPIFARSVFNTLIFNTGDEDGVAPSVVVVKTGTGGLDPGEGLKRRIVKPTGILHLPEKGRKGVEDRIDETQAIQAEIAARLAREFTEETVAIEARPPIAEMSMREIEFEIGALLRKELRTREDEAILVLLLIAASL